MDKKRYAGVLVKCKDKVLLCKRNHEGSYPGMWSIPAGKVEEDETTKHCAKREFYEETAIDIDDEELTFIGLVPRHTRDGKKVKGFMYVYLLNVDKEIEPDFNEAIDGEEHSEWKYSSLKQIDENRTGTYLYKLLEIILEKK